MILLATFKDGLPVTGFEQVRVKVYSLDIQQSIGQKKIEDL